MQMPPGSAIEFEARRDVDAVAEDVVLFHDDVAEIDADAIEQGPRSRHVPVAPRHTLLEFDRAAQRLGDALELDQHAVPGRLDKAPLAPRNRRIDEFEPHRLQARQGPGFVRLHETAVADHVRGDDCREPAIGFVRFHSFDPVGDPVPRALAPARSGTQIRDDHASPADTLDIITPAAAVQPWATNGLGRPFLTAPFSC